MKLPDATLNHWADVFVRRRVAELDVTLEQFLRDPRAHLNRIERRERYLALARQATPLDPCEVDDPATQVRGGRLTEKLRHPPSTNRPTPFAQRMFHHLLRAVRR